MGTHIDAMPHGEIEQPLPGCADVFFVTGTSRPTFMGASWQFSRNMTIVREGGELTLVNTVRLDDAGLSALDRLGKVTRVVKLGSFHGMDDAFYLERYGAKQWALAGMQHDGGHATDVVLEPGGKMPFAGASLFVYETSKMPEGVLHLDRDGGVLISCDSLQNWAEPDRFFNEESVQKMTSMGFIQPANIGPGWRHACNPQKADFTRLAALSFKHLLPAHGKPIRDSARELFSATFAREFGA